MLEADWRRLADSQPAPIPCLSWDAIQSLSAVPVEAYRPLVAAVTVGGERRALAPLEFRRRLGVTLVRPLGSDLLPRSEPLVAGDSPGIGAAAVLRSLARRIGRGSLFDIAGLWGESAGARWLTQGLSGAAGFFSARGRVDREAHLRQEWAAVEASIARTARERARGGLERGGAVITITRATAPELASALDLSRRQSRALDGPAGAVLQGLLTRSAAAGRIVLARAALRERLVAVMAVWVQGARAVELLRAAEPDSAVKAPELALRLALYRRLVEAENVASLVLPDDEHSAALGLFSVPRRQVRFVGAPYPSLLRPAAGLVAWCSRDRDSTPARLRLFAGFRPHRSSR